LSKSGEKILAIKEKRTTPLILAVCCAMTNAIHDATGARLRRPPFRKERVLAALQAADVQRAFSVVT
jgi:hypothetical protein